MKFTPPPTQNFHIIGAHSEVRSPESGKSWYFISSGIIYALKKIKIKNPGTTHESRDICAYQQLAANRSARKDGDDDMGGHPGYREASEVNHYCRSAPKHSISYGGKYRAYRQVCVVACGADMTAGREPPIRGSCQLALWANSGLATSEAGSDKYSTHGGSGCFPSSFNRYCCDSDGDRVTVNQAADVSRGWDCARVSMLAPPNNVEWYGIPALV